LNAHQYPAIGVDFARMPNLRKVQFYVPCMDTFDQPDSGTDIVTGLAKLLCTAPPEHELEMINFYFHCVLNICDELVQEPQDVDSHLRGANWAALDSAAIQLTNKIKHPFKLSILLEYDIQWFLTGMMATRKVHTKDEDTLKDWGQKYLPRASCSPNVILDVSTRLT